MRALVIGAAAVACLAAPVLAQGSGASYLCEARAHGEAGDEVDVLIGIDSAGKPLQPSALWFPAVAAESGPTGFDLPDAALGVVFERSGAAGIGQPVNISLTIAAVSPPRERLSYAVLNRRLDGYQVGYKVDNDAPKQLQMRQISEAQTPPGTAARSAELGQILPLPQNIEVRIMPIKKGEPIVRRYALEPTTSRDKLFAEAWRDAEAMAKEPASKCQRLGG